MSDLAFTISGARFDLPSAATGWRVRRLKPKGAPEMVYARDGRPLVLPLDADIDDLRREVEESGRYRLDPIDDARQPIPNAEAAYVHVHGAERFDAANLSDGGVRSPKGEDHAIEAMRLNAEMARTNADIARSLVDRFPAMLEASSAMVSTLLQAAAGVGQLPHAQPRLVSEERDDRHHECTAVATAPAFDLTSLVAQLAPVLVSAICGGKLKIPGLGATLAPPKAPPVSSGPAASRPLSLAADHAGSAEAADEGPAGSGSMSVDSAGLMQFAAIQARLTPAERELARALAGELSAGELRAWFEELRGLDPDVAAAKVRAVLSPAGSEASS